jgi:hypothetical protein
MFARRTPPALLVAALAAFASLPAAADGPKDNLPDNVRPIPPKGNALPDSVRDEIRKGLAELQGLIRATGTHDLLPDVLVYEKAVRWALNYDEVYDPKNTKTPGANVKKVLAAGLERAKQLRDGKTPWTTQTGPVLRGYKSKVDGSVQPYWLIVPADYDFAGKTKHRLDFWWHGRGETLSEANFMAGAPVASGILPAPGAMILHPYGRYCNANKFAGEIDTFECLDHAKKHYRVDEARLVARGFSMGGAACWQFGVHYPTLWAACAPGAGFSETPEFLNVFQDEKVDGVPWYEKKLWRMYNATDHALNIFNLPTVAYSGEIDRQKQAADVMAREMKKVGLDLVHVIGPKTAHAYEKGAKAEVNRRIDAIVAKRKDPRPKEIKFMTYTLRYNRCAWATITRLEKHWEPATIEGRFEDGHFTIKTKNVAAFTINLMGVKGPTINLKHHTIDGDTVPVSIKTEAGTASQIVDVREALAFTKNNAGKWTQGLPADGLAKVPGLQGPIDDAFMESFLMVRPTGKALYAPTSRWAQKEMEHAIAHWRSQFRGDAPVKPDRDVTDDDIKNNNLILWGDPASNRVLARMADKLPVTWKDGSIVVGKDEYPGKSHMPVLIYPNPLNPKKYVVLNSGFTFREYDQLNNARQVPKLPDYAVIDVTTPPNSRYPGKVVLAGFFGERWELLPDDGQ